MIPAIHSPSNFRRDDHDAAAAEEVGGGRMRPCQKAMIGWRPLAAIASRCSSPRCAILSVDEERDRGSRPTRSARFNARLLRESCQPPPSSSQLELGVASQPPATSRGRTANSAPNLPSYCGPPPPRRDPRNHLIRVRDVARLAVNAVGRVDLQPLARAFLDDHFVDVRRTEALAGCRIPAYQMWQTSVCTSRCTG